MRRYEHLEQEILQILDELDFSNQNALNEKLQGGELRNIVWQLSRFVTFPHFIDTETERVGIYRVASQWDSRLMLYLIYQGDFYGDLREGFGVWFDVDGRHFAEGEWREDAPNGQFSTQNHHTYPRTSITTGNVVNGLWHGDVIIDNPPYGSNCVLLSQFYYGRRVVLEIISASDRNLYIVGHRCCTPSREASSVDRLNRTFGVFGFAELVT